MNLHEYQAKKLLASYGLPIASGCAVETVDEAVQAAEAFGGGRWAVKAQIHAGGRGKAGGVKLANSLDEVRAFANGMLGQNLVTIQTDKHGQPVNKVFIECAVDIMAEFYLAAVIDRSSRRITFMASTEGGVDIETVAAETPEKIFRVTVDPFFGAFPWQGRRLAFQLGLIGSQIRDFAQMFVALTDMFITMDCSLLEINPLVVTTHGHLHCLDAKINIDDNALFRHADITAMRDYSQENAQEKQAAQFALSYVALDGNIGCMVNGAGLAMATMDLVKLEGGEPANFLDVGGAASQQAVAEAFKIILSDSKVKAVLINIFGGIISCVTIADGIIAAIGEIGVKIPVVIRFEGNNATLGRERLQQVQKTQGLDIITAEGLTDAARHAVAAAQ